MFAIIAMFLALLPVTAMPVHAAGNVVNVTINSDGTCSGGTAGYSACEVKTGYTEITVTSGYTLVISNPSGRSVKSSEVNYVDSQPMVYLLNGDYAGGDTDSKSATEVLSSGSITGGTFSGYVNNSGTISGGTFSGTVSNNSIGTISNGTFSGTVNNLAGTISGGTFKGYVENQGEGRISGNPAFINGIKGDTEMTLSAGYSAVSTSEYAIEGGRVSKDSGNNKITWNNVHKTLDIAAGLSAGSYTVVLRSSNGYRCGTDTILKFTLVVNPSEDHPFKYDDFNDITKQYGDADFAQTVTDAMAGRTVTYISSDENVATVDSSTGKVTIIGVGKATIKASVEQTKDHQAAEITYLLTVNKIAQSFDTTGFQDITKEFRAPDFTQTVSLQRDGAKISYESDTPTVATVNSSTGEVKIIGVGTAKITASTQATAYYEAVSASYILTVTPFQTAAVYPSGNTSGGVTFTKGNTATSVLVGKFEETLASLTAASIYKTDETIVNTYNEIIVISGNDGNWATFSIDNKPIGGGSFGSTIITLYQSYLDTLDPGTYTMHVDFGESVYGELTFTIKAPEEEEYVAPDTGVKTASTGYWGIVFLISLGAAALCILRKRQAN